MDLWRGHGLNIYRGERKYAGQRILKTHKKVFRPKRKFTDVVREDEQIIGVREVQRVRWIHCDDPKGTNWIR